MVQSKRRIGNSDQEEEHTTKRKKEYSDGDDADVQITPKRASLLGLPAELRNKIYDYLVYDIAMSTSDQDDCVKISPVYFEQPGICRANRQFRSESLGIFYSLGFVLQISDLKFGPHLGHFIWEYPPCLFITGTASWSNLKEWLRLYHSDRNVTSVWNGTADPCRMERTCIPAFDIVKRLAEARVEWRVVDEVLESFKEATHEAADGWWTWDE